MKALRLKNSGAPFGAPDSLLLEVLERRPIGVGFGCGFDAVREVGEEVEAGQALDFIDGDRIVGEAVARVGLVVEPEADG